MSNLTRPDCFDFAMRYLGEPENEEVEAYVVQLENEIERLKKMANELCDIVEEAVNLPCADDVYPIEVDYDLYRLRIENPTYQHL